MPKDISLSPFMYRPRDLRMVSGVCAAIAIRRGWNVAAVRILVLILGAVFFPIVEVVYWVATFVIPEEEPASQSNPRAATPARP